MQKYQMQERELYALWKTEKDERFSLWVRKLNALDYNKAKRAFYSELNHKNRISEK